MNEQTLIDLQHKVESLFHCVEGVTNREYYLFTEFWQYLEDLKTDGNGERGVLRRALESKRHKSIQEGYKR